MEMDSSEAGPPLRREAGRAEPGEEEEEEEEGSVDGDRDRRHRYEEDTAATTSREKVSRYTSVLRRDGTVRGTGDQQYHPHQVHRSSGSTSSGNDPASRPRRPAMG